MSRSRRERGQALVEFALIIPLFAMLVFALLDFGRVVYAQNTVSEAAREAARVGTLEPAAAAWKYDAIRAAAVDKAPGLGLTTANVTGDDCTDCFYPAGAFSGGVVVVTVTTRVDLLTPILSQVLGGSFTVTTISRGFIP